MYRRYGPVVYARCRRLLKDASLAEDATQEVFVRVFRHLDKAPDERAALAWIYRIATNWCLNVLRDRAAQAEPVDELPDRAGDHPEPGLAQRDLAMRMVMRAPQKLQAPAVLYHLDGMEQLDIARTLGISRRTVINRLNEFADRSRAFAQRAGGDR